MAGTLTDGKTSSYFDVFGEDSGYFDSPQLSVTPETKTEQTTPQTTTQQTTNPLQRFSYLTRTPYAYGNYNTTPTPMFDHPAYDPNAGRQEAYDREYAKYMADLRNSGRRRVNLKRANEAFEQRFNESWQQGESGRRSAYLADRKQKMDEYWNSRMKEHEDAIAEAYKQEGYTFDEATGKWSRPLTHGLDFNNTKAVQQWLMNHGQKLERYGDDGHYGTETNNAITAMLNDQNVNLSDEERQKFMNLQTAWQQQQNNAAATGNGQQIVTGNGQVVEAPVEEPVLSSNAGRNAALLSQGNVGRGYEYLPETQAIIDNSNGYLRQPQHFMGINNGRTQVKAEDGKIYDVIVTDNQYVNAFDHKNDRSFAYDPETGKIRPLRENWFGGSNGRWAKFDNGWGTFEDYGIQYKKQGGTLIKKHQQGGNMEQDIQAQVKQLVQAVAAGDQQAAEQVKQIMQAAEQGDQQALQIAQMIQAEIEAIKSAKRGAKLNYIKSLKGNCPDGEEVVYFQKGGQLCKACQKKHDKMVAEKGKKLNPIEEFKKGRKTKKC